MKEAERVRGTEKNIEIRERKRERVRGTENVEMKHRTIYRRKE